jgi:hypothetical protein
LTKKIQVLDNKAEADELDKDGWPERYELEKELAKIYK